MEKEELLSGFKKVLGEPGENGIIGDTGISSKTLEAFIESLAPSITDDTKVDDAFYGRNVALLKSMGGQMRHEIAEFVKKFKTEKAEEEKKKMEQEGREKEKETETNPDKALLSRITALEAKLEESERKNREGGIRRQLEESGKSLKVTNRELWKDVTGMIELGDGVTLESATENAKQIYERKLKSYVGNGAVPYSKDDDGCDVHVSPEAKKHREEFMESLRRRGMFPNNGNK